MIRFTAVVLGVLVSAGAAIGQVAGWQVLSGEWSETDGVITGTAADGHAWLMSDADYHDFNLELEFRTPKPCNGGVQVRSHWLPKLDGEEGQNQFYGPQINVETRTEDGTGSIIDENGRGRLVAPSLDAQAAVKKEDWNTLRIEARDFILKVWINGVPSAHLFDEKFIGGKMGLQVMPLDAEPGVIEYRDIKIEDLGRVAEWRSLFNGENLDGWKNIGEENFVVEDGAIHGYSGPKEKYGYLLTEEDWTDFRVRGDFKMLGDGNYGLFYRSKVTIADDGEVRITGVQGEVDPRFPTPTGWHYESYKRGWIIEPDPNSVPAYLLRQDQWNTIEIRAVGNRTTSWVNGMVVNDFYDTNPQVFKGGFALQLHSGGGDGILWKNLYVIDK